MVKRPKFSWKRLFTKPYICITIYGCTLVATCSWSWCRAYSWVMLHKADKNATALQHSAHSFWVREIFSTWKERLCSLCRQATVCVCVRSAGTPGTVSSFSGAWLCNSCLSAFCSHTGPSGVNMAASLLSIELLTWQQTFCLLGYFCIILPLQVYRGSLSSHRPAAPVSQ